MEVSLSIDDIINSSIILSCSGEEVPCTVIVERIAGISSSAGIRSLFATSGSTVVILDWSSIIARPSIECSEFGRVRMTGHVRL